MSGYWHESDVSSSDSDLDGKSAAVTTSEGKSKALRVAASCSPNDGGQKRMKAEWLSGSWPLKAFDGSLPTHKRKAEWVRFRDQFERIVSCKATVDPVTKLTGMKIFAGDSLLNIIEMQEKLVTEQATDVYAGTIKALDKFFNQTCDTSKERMIFREMRMDTTEPFVDWVLRLEKQAKFCEFGEEQRKEEFIQALIRRSVPVIAEKLYEMSHIWDNDMEKIVNYGKHLDYMRAEIKEASDKAKTSSNANEAMDTDSESPYKAVNVLHNRGHKAFSNRFEPYRRREVNRSSILQRRTNLHTGRRSDSSRTSRCNKCGTSHRPRDCKAFRAKCFNCDMVGHFAEFCREPSRSGDRSRSLKPSYRTDYIKEQASSINQVSFENTDD